MATPDKNIQKMMDNIDKAKRSLYSDIYYNDDTANREIKMIRSELDTNLQKISNVNFTNTGVNNISRLYAKTLSIQNKTGADLINNINGTLSDSTAMDRVMSVYMENTWVRDIDAEIDMVCKYLPKLDEALQVRKEHVLTADSFTKSPMIVRPKNAVGDNASLANENIISMMKKHDLEKRFDQWYTDMERKGEIFLYVVPYKKAIDALLKAKQSTIGKDGVDLQATNESVEDRAFALFESIGTIGSFNESSEFIDDLTKKNNKRHENAEEEKKILESVKDIQININKSRVLTSAIKERYDAMKYFAENGSLFFNEDGSIVQDIPKNTDNFNNFTNDKGNKRDMLSGDGNFDTSKSSIHIPGCLIKLLDHAMVKPLYIDDICLGYFYIECDKKLVLEQTTFSSTIGGIRPGTYNRPHYDPYGHQGRDVSVLKTIAAQVSEKITAQFTNKNQDLAKEIYHILKYNATVDGSGKISKINITFIPPEDINHEYFEFDNETKHGKSQLARSLFPAKLFACMYISNVIQIITRGNDKRVYYVKQSVDKNIAGVMSGVINQIQRGNFGIRQIESMNSILNMVGRFNDFVIPRSPGGEAPVDFEVLPGQSVEVKTELMNLLEEMAIDATNVPMEVISMRQQADYATHLSMTNSKFLNSINRRQSITQAIFSKIITKIYNFEYNLDTGKQEEIEVILPPPIYLAAMNNAQIIDSVNSAAESLSKIQYSDNEQEKQMEFAREFKRLMCAHVFPPELIEEARNRAEMNLAKNSDDNE